MQDKGRALFGDAHCREKLYDLWKMSTLALEIDQTLQQLDAATASHFERLVRDAMELVKPATVQNKVTRDDIRFPLVKGRRPISDEDVAKLGDEE